MKLNHQNASWKGLCAFRTLIPDPDSGAADTNRECWVKGTGKFFKKHTFTFSKIWFL